MLSATRFPSQKTSAPSILKNLPDDADTLCFAAADEWISELSGAYDSGPDLSDEEMDYLAARRSDMPDSGPARAASRLDR
jgi:hypothetical protein